RHGRAHWLPARGERLRRESPKGKRDDLRDVAQPARPRRADRLSRRAECVAVCRLPAARTGSRTRPPAARREWHELRDHALARRRQVREIAAADDASGGRRSQRRWRSAQHFVTDRDPPSGRWRTAAIGVFAARPESAESPSQRAAKHQGEPAGQTETVSYT